MHKKIMVAGLTLILFVFTGCGTKPTVPRESKVVPQESREANKDPRQAEGHNENKAVPQESPKVNSDPRQTDTPVDKSVLKKEADAKVGKYIEGIVKNEPKLMVDTMSIEKKNYHSEEIAIAAIKDLKYLFGDATIKHDFEGEQKTQDSSVRALFKYRLYNDAGRSKTLKVILLENQTFITGDIFLTYSLFARNRIDGFIQALRNKDAAKAAGALSEDDLFYPLNEAEKAVARYEESFDLNTIDYKLLGITDTEDSFSYLITGEKNGVPVEHQLLIVCGDGLTGIRDNWIASAQEVGTTTPSPVSKKRLE